MRLTKGEAWWLRRRRLGLTQAEVARSMGLSEEEYRTWEQDLSPDPLLPIERDVMGAPLSLGEYSALARRRAGLGLAAVARRRRISRQTLVKQEHDRTTTARDLAEWWRARGYPAPGAPASVTIGAPRGLGRAAT